MKLKAWLLPLLAPLTALSVLAQTSNTLPPVIAPPTPAAPAAPEPEPAAKPAKHAKAKAKAKHKKAPLTPSAHASTNSVIVLDPPVVATVKCNVLDVRGQGSFTGEIITYVKKGENLTVLEEVTLGHARAGEPGQWSRIVMPANTAVWVDSDYIEPDSMAVRVKKINVRGGPGENYSVVGRLEKGTVVKEIGKKGSWLEIVAPTNAYAFVASQYLEKSAASAPEVAAAPAPAPAEQTPAAPPPSAPTPVVVNVPSETPPATAQPVVTPPAASLTAPAPTAASQSDQELLALHRATAPQPLVTLPGTASSAPGAAAPEPAKDEGPRIVTVEGFVHRAMNIQAPSGYELHDIKTGVLTEYLQPAPGQKTFKVFVGTRVRLTGTEFLDPDWPRTPVLHVETVDLMP